MRQSADQSSTSPAGLPEHIPVAPRRRRRAPKLVIVEPPPPSRNRRNDRGERMLTVVEMFDGEAHRPMIRMRGAWLEALGFAIGARVAVSEERGRIVLTLESEAQ